MLLEAQGQYEDALELYNAALKQDETYAPIIKRKVAVLIDQGKTHDAITALTHYLDHFHADLEAWTTLSQVYLRSQMFQQAAFALEECMIMGGFNFLYHIRYAEVNMTLNRPAVALKYFCSAVEVTESGGGALRAWYGVRQASHALLENHNKVSLGNTGSNPKQSGKKGAVAAASHGIQESVDNDVVSPEEWKALNALAGERIEAIYKAKKVSTENIEVVKGWLNTVSA
ncbi:hypothetical protein BDR26DRAFT_866256 [Obelidium mucronatum]|nr:hypothetical protein BDR26DRAFT_866256 [Obelidium mucronatum]